MRKFLALLLVCLLVGTALAKSKKERKSELLKELADEKERAEKLAEEVEALDEEEDVDDDEEDSEESEEAAKNEMPVRQFDDDDDEEEEMMQADEPIPVDGINPCEIKKCGRGMECKIVNNSAVCECYGVCRKQDDRHHVCSKSNVTFETECDLDRQYCLCSRDLEGCKDSAYKTVKLDYFGSCKKLPGCSAKQLKEFRVRVQEWLMRVMKDLKARSKIPDYDEWLTAAKKEKNHEHAVVWRFCQLDSSPRDTFMSRRELQFTIHSLKGMEQCLVPFLSDCDTNADRKISLGEWEKCLNLDKDQVPKHCLPLQQE